jgi:hypothetical protein
MTTLFIILLALAFLCFVLAAAKVVTRVELLALGLALWVLVPLIQHIRAA